MTQLRDDIDRLETETYGKCVESREPSSINAGIFLAIQERQRKSSPHVDFPGENFKFELKYQLARKRGGFMRCRLNAPLMVLAYGDNHQAATTVPAGETIEVLGLDRDDRFSVVCVRNEKFIAFESDVRERGVILFRKEEQTRETSLVRRAAAGE
ncbi:MAG TPA: hypothetical protein VMG40_17365 [Bryobacteraceae bacterium]|nr:hypothetical protein [Bryobacteraceae bacterium]